MSKSKSNLPARIDPASVAQQIVGALSGGLVEAARIYRQYVEDGGDPMALRRHVPLGASVWSTLDDVATGRIDPRVMCLPGRVQSAVRMLPAKEQTELIDSGIDVLAGDGSAIRVPLVELTADQADVAFDHGRLRSISAQAAYIHRAVPKVQEPDKPRAQFEVRAGKLVVYQPVTLSVSDLHRILAQMG
jgi:hypothetical protein